MTELETLSAIERGDAHKLRLAGYECIPSLLPSAGSCEATEATPI